MRNELLFRAALLAFVFGAVVVSVAIAPQFHSVRSSSYRTLWTDDLEGGAVPLDVHARLAGDWIAYPQGLVLAPGTRATAELQLTAVDGTPVLTLTTGVGGYVRTTVECVDANGARRHLLTAADALRMRVYLEGCAASDGRTVPVSVASVHGGGSGDPLDVAIDRVEFGVARRLPPVSTWLCLVVLVYIAAFGAAAIVELASGPWIAAGISTALSVWALVTKSDWLEPWTRGGVLVNGPLVLGAAIVAGFTLVSVTKRRHDVRGQLPVLALAWLLAAALLPRWQQLELHLGDPLWPDSSKVLGLARTMEHPYDTWIREPFWPWAAWIFEVVFGPSDLSARLMSEVASVALFLTTYLLAMRFARSRWLGVAAASFIAWHDTLIGSSAQGHRTELLALGFVLLCYFAFVDGLRPNRRAVGLTASATMLALTSLTLSWSSVRCWFGRPGGRGWGLHASQRVLALSL